MILTLLNISQHSFEFESPGHDQAHETMLEFVPHMKGSGLVTNTINTSRDRVAEIKNEHSDQDEAMFDIPDWLGGRH